MPLLYEKGRFGVWYWKGCKWAFSLKWLFLNPEVRNCMIGPFHIWLTSEKRHAKDVACKVQ